MGARRKAREVTLKALYACEIGEQTPTEVFESVSAESKLPSDAQDFARNLFMATLPLRAEHDKRIAALSRNWDIERIAPIDKNILRIGMTEISKFPDIPKKVTINEAVELARRYGSAESPAFVNGILDSYAATAV